MDGTFATETTIEPGGYVRGTFCVPGDKSVSHRYAILSSMAVGQSTIRGFAPGADCAATLRCLRGLGVSIDVVGSDINEGSVITVEGAGPGGFRPPSEPLNAENSGTTMRLMAGVMAAQPFNTTITGDASLSQRPMQRVVDPLERMGARIETNDGHPPLTINGGSLRGFEFVPTIASAQVKSAVLLAGLYASGETWVSERVQTRDHTERALRSFGVNVQRRGKAIGVAGGQRLTAMTLAVPGDFSSAAFWIVAAAALPGSAIEITNVGLNPTRTRLLDVLQHAGAKVIIKPTDNTSQELIGTIRVVHGDLRPIVVTPLDVPALIDELPALAALAVHGRGLRVSGAAELRTKESDRISVLVSGLRQLGAHIDEHPDGFEVHESAPPTGGIVDAAGDHRMAMAFAIAALGATGPTVITGHEIVSVSYPNFFNTLGELRRA